VLKSSNIKHKQNNKEKNPIQSQKKKQKDSDSPNDSISSLESSAAKIPVGSPAEATIQKSIEEMKVP